MDHLILGEISSQSRDALLWLSPAFHDEKSLCSDEEEARGKVESRKIFADTCNSVLSPERLPYSSAVGMARRWTEMGRAQLDNFPHDH
jgi:hypothetical protein